MHRSQSQAGGRNIPLSARLRGERVGVRWGIPGLNRIDIGHYGLDRCLTGFLARQRGALPMPWKETCVMDEKTAFIVECLRGELPMTALCERYGISRDTGYRLLGRYREEGPGGLEPRSRAPHRHGMAMAEVVAARSCRCGASGRSGAPRSCARYCSGAIRNGFGRRPRRLAICCGTKG